jgi:hypothetical protein
MSFSWTVSDWWMEDQVQGMKMTNEFWASDLTDHAGGAFMQVAIEETKASHSPSLIEEHEGCGETLPADQK